MASPAFDYKMITGPLADFIKVELQMNQDAVVALITKNEASVENAIVTSLKSIAPTGGILGQLDSYVTSALIKYAASVVTKYGPNVLFAFIEKEVDLAASALGG